MGMMVKRIASVPLLPSLPFLSSFSYLSSLLSPSPASTIKYKQRVINVKLMMIMVMMMGMVRGDKTVGAFMMQDPLNTVTEVGIFLLSSFFFFLSSF